MNEIMSCALVDTINLSHRLHSFCVQFFHVFKFFSGVLRAAKKTLKRQLWFLCDNMIPRAGSLGEEEVRLEIKQ